MTTLSPFNDVIVSLESNETNPRFGMNASSGINSTRNSNKEDTTLATPSTTAAGVSSKSYADHSPTDGANNSTR